VNQTRIYHPALDRYIAVPESAVPIHRNSGWILADEVGTEAAESRKPASRDVSTSAADTSAADDGKPEGTPAKNTPAKNRRQPEEQ